MAQDQTTVDGTGLSDEIAQGLAGLLGTAEKAKEDARTIPKGAARTAVAGAADAAMDTFYAAQSLQIGLANPAPTPTPTPTPQNVVATPTAAEAAAAAAAEQAQRNNLAILKGTFDRYNLSSLYAKIEEYVKQGFSNNAIEVMLRDTPEYKERFPAMEVMAKKGRAISEASYIDYERTAAQLETQYGLPKGMLSENVEKLLVGDVSATEMAERVQLASANSLMAPAELKQALSDYYGIGQGGLTAYFLDPGVAQPLLQKQAAAARIGSEALRQGIGLDVYGAENLQELGISQEAARQGFQQIAGLQELTSGAGDVTSNAEMTAGLLAGDQAAVAGLNRAAGARVARFQQGGQYLASQQGVTGLTSAQTT